KAVFSPIDVIEEYTRPARFRENGRLLVKPALSEVELLDFAGVGTLEAFNSDGLRTLLKTIEAPTLKEKTLRYPGHAEKMRLLRETGFFSQEEVEIDGQQVRPLDLTAKLLFARWKLKEEEADLTVMQVIVEGKKDGERYRIGYNLLDKYDPATQTHSMARTTGYTATAAARMIGQGLYTKRGISPPEFIGREPGCVDFILRELETRGVIYQETREKIE
ncbi:MAG: saccharopine dehydrogenase, partial [Phycisphaerae bacterium SM23_30]